MDAQLAGQALQALGTLLAPVLVQAYRERKSRKEPAAVRQGTLRRTKRPSRRGLETEPEEVQKAA